MDRRQCVFRRLQDWTFTKCNTKEVNPFFLSFLPFFFSPRYRINTRFTAAFAPPHAPPSPHSKASCNNNKNTEGTPIDLTEPYALLNAYPTCGAPLLLVPVFAFVVFAFVFAFVFFSRRVAPRCTAPRTFRDMTPRASLISASRMYA